MKKKISTLLLKGLENVWNVFKSFFCQMKDTGISGSYSYRFDSTKTLRTLFIFLSLIATSFVIYVYWYKLFGSNESVKSIITNEILETYLGLAGITNFIAPFMQYLYTKNKQ